MWKKTADVDLILGGFDDGMSGMISIFLNSICTLGDLIKRIFSQNSGQHGGSEAFDGCSHFEFTVSAWR